MSKNICVFIQALPAGGAEKQAIMLTYLLSCQHHIYLVLYKNNIDKRLEILLNKYAINVQILKGNPVVKWIQLYRFFKAKKIDVIISYLLTANLIGSVIGSIARVPFRLGGIRNAMLDKKKEIIERFIHNRLNTLTIFNNYSGASRYATRGFNEDKITVIPNCIEIPDISTNTKKTGDTSILSVGRFVEQKDFLLAIDVINELIISGIMHFKYQIIGNGKMEYELRSRISKLNLDNYISIIVNPTCLDDYYRNADIYLCSSIFEGTSNTILEAMAYHLPVVATNVGDNNLLIEDGNNGFLSPAKDLKGLSNSLKKLIENKELRCSFGDYGYKKVKKEYSQKSFIEKYTHLLNTITEAHYEKLEVE